MKNRKGTLQIDRTLTDKSYNNIYICSAYNDLRYILFDIQNKADQTNLIIVTTIDDLYQFILTIKKPFFDIIFFKSEVKKNLNPVSWLQEGVNLYKIKKFCKKIQKANVFIISLYFDVISLYIFVNLGYNNLLFSITSDFFYGSFIKIPSTTYTLFCNHFYNIPIAKFRTSNINTIGLTPKFVSTEVNNYLLNNEEGVNQNIIQYKKQIEVNCKFVLILLSKFEEELFLEPVLSNLFSLFIKTYPDATFVSKGHPQEGEAFIIDKFNLKKINKKLPLEFLDLSNSIAVIGVLSVGLANLANQNIRVYSLLEFIKDKKLISDYKKYLLEHSKNIHFLNNENSLN